MLYVICGPTCSGKTSLALKLSDKLNCHIINADAFQIYKEMNIGTAKIKDKQYLAKHLLMDIVEPNEEYSIKEYREDFWKALDSLNEKNVVICGGSGLYIRSALYDYSFPDYEDDVSDLNTLSSDELYRTLKNLDSKSAENIHPNNRKRMIHAISLARSGHAKSETIEKQEHKLVREDVRFIFINPNREELYKRINERVDIMFEEGLIVEVKTLLNKYELSKTAKAAIGYKETIDYLRGECSLEECKDLIKQRTRNYAKRQVTYFKHQLPCENYDSLEKAEEELL